MGDVPFAFISYTRFDNEHNDNIITKTKNRLESELRSQTGRDHFVFQDTTGINVGKEWHNEILMALEAADVFVAFMTPSFFSSKPCRDELEYFYLTMKDNPKKKIIPIYLTSCKSCTFEDNEMFSKLFRIQYEDWRGIKCNGGNDHDFKESVSDIATKMLDSYSQHDKLSFPHDSINKYSSREDVIFFQGDNAKQMLPENFEQQIGRLIPHGFSFESVVYGDISGGSHVDAAVFSKSQDMETLVSVVVYDEVNELLNAVYTTSDLFSTVRATFNFIPEFNQKILIIERVSGSGRYLHYTVLGYIGNVLKILLDRSMIFDGGIYLNGNRFIEMSGSQGMIFQWDGHAMLGTRLALQPIAPRNVLDKVFEYTIDDDCNVHSESSQTIHLHIGQSLRVVRTDQGVVDRVLYNYDGIISFIDGAATATKLGTTHIKIIPGGYEWAKALTITVIVE